VKPEWWHKIVSPASLEFYKEGRATPGFSFRKWVHGYFYGRWTYFYIGFGTGHHPLARRLEPALTWGSRLLAGLNKFMPSGKRRDQISFADTYHGKVVPLKAAADLLMVNEDIQISNLEKVIPYQLAKDLILNHPDHIVVLDCPCRAAKPDPCLPMDVCLVIGEPFAGFVLQHHPERSRAISKVEAVEILQAEERRGHVHHAFFKEAMLNRFYAICNCCSCCCGAMHAHQNGTPMLASSGYIAQVDDGLCCSCGTCIELCQFSALTQNGFTPVIDPEACMGCGICATNCPEGALSLVLAPQKGQPLEIREILNLHDNGGNRHET
jgi:ferredoxin